MDLALADARGGLPPPFRDAYFEARPRAAGFDERADCFALYPALVALLHGLVLAEESGGGGGALGDARGRVERVCDLMERVRAF